MSEKKIKISYLCLILISSAIVITDFHFRFLVGKELTPREGFQFIPQEALVTLYISTTSQDWQQIKKLVPSEARNFLKYELNTFMSRMAVLKEINYQQDIRPWIGNVMLAFLPKNNFESESDRENYLLIVGIKNKIKLLNFANKLERQYNQQLESNNYKNIPIVKITDDEHNVLFLAILKNQLLVSPQTQILESAIDTWQIVN
ncbi:hypothetical protein H1P_230028 [Hyella patelloides LEGE 07179]|uniref:DUF3352 domain-containing protein n=1 Tax=Hyella patelloides LEGE 07179 TaxID=945734 RepID=A0A563VRD2_9CYAN|nr:DUF3352 domain-containing protein [Hyella patelloides]VEP13964.1 hypothetical protein H1P_230028 [Hyella patelloides LEGE 07179]